MSDLCIADVPVESKEAGNKELPFRIRILLFVLCLLFWAVTVICTQIRPVFVRDHRLFFLFFFWCALLLSASLGIYQVKIEEKAKNKNEEIYTENEELAAQLEVLQKRTADLQHLMQVRHDVRAQYNVIYSLAQLGRITEIEKYVSSIYNDLASVDDFPVGISSVLAVTIGQIRKEAREKKIDFEYHITSQELGMNPRDITVLFSNILENAVEGAFNAEAEKPYIELLVSRKDNRIFIHCENSVDGSRLKKLGNGYRTSKPDSENHGIGMSIIKKVFQTYHGKVDTEVEGGRFVLSGRYECRKG